MLADLACASLAGVLWIAQPELGWRPLIIAFLPWAIRLVGGNFPFRRTPFDLNMAIFLLTAGIGVWAAYDRDEALAKFWLIVGAIFLFYAFAGQPRRNIWLVTSLLGLIGIVFAVYFLLTGDWEVHPTGVQFMQRIAIQWMSVRPELGLGIAFTDRNLAAGILTMMFPFLVALALRARSSQRFFALLIMVFGGIIALFALFLTIERGAFAGLAFGLGIWLAWSISSKVDRAIGWRPGLLFGLFVILLLGVGLVYSLSIPEGLLGMVDRLPGSPSVRERLALAADTLDLVADYPYSGGGLSSFPGLYSQYILIIPVLFLTQGHNLFINIALEQGIAGLLVIGVIYVGCLWLLLKPRQRQSVEALAPGDEYLRWAITAGMLAVVVYGLLEDPYYSGYAAELLFLLPGMAIAITTTRLDSPRLSENGIQAINGTKTRQAEGNQRIRKVVLVVGVGLLGSVLWLFRNPLISSLYANVGAVEMARAELVGWPANEEVSFNETYLRFAQANFLESLRLNAQNRTGNYRLGLIAMRDNDFTSAARFLGEAHRKDSEHRGVRKALGYSLTWIGHSNLGLELLREIPEARYEMNIYARWWVTQGRGDLAGRAENMALLLESEGAPLMSTPQ